MFKIKKIFQTS